MGAAERRGGMKTSRPVAAIAAGFATLALVIGFASPAVASPPVSSINLNCDKLAAAVDPPASFTVPVAQRYASASLERDFGGIPDTDYVQMAGGLACEWSNNLPLAPGSSAGGVGVRVEYLPYAASGYWRWASVLGPVTTPDDFTCVSVPSDSCQFMSSAGGDWLFVEVQDASSEAVAEDLSRRISTALQLGQKTPYVPPVYATPLPHTCQTLIRPTVYGAAIGTRTPLVAWPAPPGWSPVNSAMLINRGLFCEMDDATGSFGGGRIQALPGGQWAFALLRSSLTTPGPLTPLRAAGMRAGDAAFTRCDATHRHCVLDALIATHWIEVDLLPSTLGGDLITRDRLTASRLLLREIVGQIYP